MSEEDDTELILEGGELYKYFKSQGEIIQDVYSPSKQAAEPTLSSESFLNSNSIHVPVEVANIVDIILKSNLLLEEDASYLFRRFSELVPQTQRRTPYKLVLPGIIIGISVYGYWKFNLTKLCSSFIACSAVYLFSEISNLLNRLKHTENIKKILLDLKDIATYIKKNIKLMQEEDSLIFSKEKVLQLRSGVNLINEHTLSRKKLEIFIVGQKLIYVLKRLILLSRNITLAVFKKQEWKSLDCNSAYLAQYSDERLGINKFGETKGEETNVLSSIDILRNLYLVIQSETLREFGLHLCGFTKVEEISSVIDITNQYKSKSTEISSELKKIYDTYFYPLYVTKKVKSDNKNVKYLGNLVNSVSSSLNSLLIDSRNLENFINENSDEIELETNQNIGCALLKMERELSYLKEHIHSSAQQFLKQTNNYVQNISHPTPTSNEKIIKTECMVGKSDFSISGQDEVFLGLVEGIETTNNDYDSVGEYRKPTDLGFLINELKSALIAKRVEFEKRELSALKSLEDIENYKSCSSVIKTITVSSQGETNTIPEQSASSKSEIHEEIINAIPLSKDIARQANDFFKSWNRNVTDECFGDETEEED